MNQPEVSMYGRPEIRKQHMHRKTRVNEILKRRQFESSLSNRPTGFLRVEKEVIYVDRKKGVPLA